jgi:hypothetical protein
MTKECIVHRVKVLFAFAQLKFRGITLKNGANKVKPPITALNKNVSFQRFASLGKSLIFPGVYSIFKIDSRFRRD